MLVSDFLCERFLFERLIRVEVFKGCGEIEDAISAKEDYCIA
jgi:hypothetical protein